MMMWIPCFFEKLAGALSFIKREKEIQPKGYKTLIRTSPGQKEQQQHTHGLEVETLGGADF
jgi:hypothetical protein